MYASASPAHGHSALGKLRTVRSAPAVTVANIILTACLFAIARPFAPSRHSLVVSSAVVEALIAFLSEGVSWRSLEERIGRRDRGNTVRRRDAQDSETV